MSAAAVLAAGLTWSIVTASPSQALNGTVQGGVYIDKNMNGTYDSSASGQTEADQGFPGVKVRAFDSTGAEVGSATVGSDGTYTMSVTNAATSDLRVEFEVPAGYAPTVLSNTTITSGTTAQLASNTSIQFVTLGATWVNLGLQIPSNYCESNVNIAGVCVRRGPVGYTATGIGVVKMTSYTTPSTSTTNVATKPQTGVAWGLGWQRTNKLFWTAAFIRSHAGLGPKGIGGVYVTNTSGTLVTSFDLAADKGLVLEPSTGYYSDANRGMSVNTDAPHRDPRAFSGVGKAGIGDLDISLDGRYLWVTNLYQRKIHRMEITGTAAAPTLGPVETWNIDDGYACTNPNSVLRAWGLEPNADGSIKVGAVCTNENSTPSYTTYPEGGVILNLNPAGTGSSAWSTLTTVDLSYPHVGDFAGVRPGGATTGPSYPARWLSWTDDWATVKPLAGGFLNNTHWNWDQPIITDIETMRDGSLVLGMSNRISYQLGKDNYGPLASDGTTLITSRVGGDALLLCKTATGWAQESNGTCTGTTTYTAGTRSSPSVSWEFFDDVVKVPGAPHPEQVIGGLAIAPPNYPQSIAIASMDPNSIGSGGITWKNLANGNEWFDGTTRRQVNLTTEFDKGAGMGDLEVLCDAAPLQIGNRVWKDTDGDGIQDPGEPVLAGVTVRLYDSAGTLVSTAVTDSGGRYYFSSTLTEAANGGATPDAAGGNLKANTAYTIRLDNPTNYAAGGPLSGLGPTPADGTTSAATDQEDFIDSDASPAGTGTSWGVNQFAQIAVDPHAPGQVDHTLDFGLVQLVGVGNYVWVDSNRDGVQDVGETPVQGVTVTLYRPGSTSPAVNVFGAPATATTAADGSYFIDSLAPGEYIAQFSLPTGYAFTSTGGGTGATDSNPDETGRTPAFTISGSATGDTTTESNSATLATFANLTIDAGIVGTVSVGNYVWFDSNGDGLQDASDIPLAGVTLTITDSNNNPVTDVYGDPVGPTTTDANGFYLFDNLPYGTYKVSVVTPAGLVPTKPSQGGDTAADSSTGTATSSALNTPGGSDLTLDFGFVKAPVSVGDFVWIDTNRDGIQDAGEPGVAGAVLALTDMFGNPVKDADGNTVAPITTGADGLYLFENLPAGQYKVNITYPPGYGPTEAAQGGDTAEDSSTDTATSAVLGAGDEDLSLDFGVVPKVSVGNYVWFDSNNNGIQDAGDLPLSGVTLTISDANNPGATVYDTAGNPVTTTTTDANGFYLFDNLLYGKYTVTVTPPTGMQPAQTGQGTTETDSSSGSETSTDLDTPGEADLSLDFGFVRPSVSVGDFVWYDLDNDGLQEAGEPGLAGVRLTLSDLAGNPVTDVFGNTVADVFTDANGNYSFENLPLGQYRVTATTPGGFLPTTTGGAGTDSTNDSSLGSADSADMQNDGDSDPTLDFGFYVPPPAVGTRVWIDLDYDGLQDPGEAGLAGVTLTLKDSGGNVLATATTDADGNYLFDDGDGMDLGNAYTVEITYPAGYAPTKAGDGTNPLDSSTDSATSSVLNLAGPVDLTLDFGVVPVVSVGDYVWEDVNRDGLQDASDVPIKDVTLTISNADDPSAPVYDLAGNLVTTTTTDADGKYLFDNLPPGRYKVTVTPPSGYVATTAGAGSDPALDSSTGSATSAVLDTPNESDLTLDFGFVKPAVSVGNFVWLDSNGDGIQTAGEPGVAGAVLTLSDLFGNPITDVKGNPVTPITTGADGLYLFENLPVGSYKVTITYPPGYSATVPGAGSDTANDSSTDSATSSALFLNGESDLTLDFGLVAKVSVGNFVWLDSNRNGLQDEGEPGIEGVTLSITDKDGNPVYDTQGNPVTTTTTDANGSYLFDNLPYGEYKVTVTDPTGLSPTTAGEGSDPRDSSTGSAVSADLQTPDALDDTLDFGFVSPLVAVGDYVWVDLDADGIQDANEPPLEGVKVTLFESDGTTPASDGYGDPVPAVYTDADGFYFIDRLAAGQYRIKFELPAGYSFTTDTPVSGGTSSNDSNPDEATGLTPVFTLDDALTGDMEDAGTYVSLPEGAEASFVNPTIDAGVIAPIVAVGDYVWLDENVNGIQDATEAGVKSVKVELFNADGTPANDADGNPVPAVYTDSTGYYFIDNLIPGKYYIVFTEPDSYNFTLQAQGTNRGKDSNPGSDGQTPEFTIAATATGTTIADSDPDTTATLVNPTIDAGLTQAAVGVGDYTWIDTNRDGKQSPGEPVFANVFVQLLNPDGTLARDADGLLVPYAYTDADGFYFFDNLRPGEYRVQFLLPAGYSFTDQFKGSDGTIDSNANPTNGLSAVFRIEAAATGDTIAAASYGDLPAGADALFVNPTIDAGVIAPVVAVGNYTWVDADQDGVQDASEVPLKGVQVTLFNADGSPATDYDGAPVSPVLTDANGYYLFDNLLPGDYYIEFAVPPGYALTTDTPGAGGTVANDSNPDPVTGQTPVFTVAAVVSGTTVPDTDPANKAVLVNPTIDAGFVPPLVAVGDYVWIDTNKDGVQSEGEPVLAGVKVYLFLPDGVTPAKDADGAVVAVATTDENGLYFFDNLLPGDYRIKFVLPAGYSFTSPLSGGDDTLDSDANVVTGLTSVFTISATASGDTIAAASYGDLPVGAEAVLVNPTIDAGVIAPVVAVGNYVWVDADRDGVQGASEVPLKGVQVTLFHADGSPATDYDGDPVAPVFSDGDGFYLFDNLLPGDYYIEFAVPPGYALTTDTPGAGGTVANDSNPDPVTGQTPVFTVAAVVSGTTVPDADPANKAVLVNPTVDAGFVPPLAAVGDYVWQDRNKNGLQDAGELPLAGTKVQLLRPDGSIARDADGDPVPAVYTDEDGFYFIDNLLPGDYRIQFTLPDGYTFTGQFSGGDASIDSNADPALGLTPTFTIGALALGDTVAAGSYPDLPAGARADFVNPTVDAGAVPPVVAVADYAWIDVDADGVQDLGEAALAGVKVELLNPDGSVANDYDGNPVAPVFTDEFGYYFIDNLIPGEYRVRFTAPSGYDITTNGSGISSADSNPDPVTGESPVFTLHAVPMGNTVFDTDTDTLAQLVDPTVDAGFVPVVAIGDYAWVDLDQNGRQDAGEPSLAGVKVTLYGSDGVTAAKDADGVTVPFATTDSNGFYFFDNLLPGSYRIRFELPDGYVFTAQTTGSDGAVDSDPEDTIGATDYGWTSVFSVAPSVSGDTVSVGTYALEPVGAKALFVNPTIDAGAVPLVGMGDYTWVDSDRDGLQDPTELALKDVVVKLFVPGTNTQATDVYGNPAQATTDAAGFYFVDDLLPGDYYATFTLPDANGYTFTKALATSVPLGFLGALAVIPDNELDSNPDRYTGVTGTFSIAPEVDGETVAQADTTVPSGADALFVNPTIDAGIVPVVAIANYFWFDKDGDGVRDPGEDPVPGGKVELTDPNGDPVKDADGNTVPPATTGGNGYFLFDNLVPGTYRLKFTPPSGYAFTSKGDDDTDGQDSNTNPNGVTDPFEVLATPQGSTESENAGSTKATLWNPNVGAGLVPIVAIGNYVWADDDEDGRQDRGETGIPGVKVELLNPDGETIATGADGLPVPAVFTNSDGRYLIDNLVPGTYRVRFSPPLYYAFTLQDEVADDALDSDADPITGLTEAFTVFGDVLGNTTADTNQNTQALYVDLTVDAGVFGELPPTGTTLRNAVLAAMIALACGALLTLTARRRRRLAA